MKTIGIIGGLSPESTSEYYLYLNKLMKQRFGGLSAPLVLINSVNQQILFDLKTENRWLECGNILSKSAQQLQSAGADIIILATNTMHNVADQIERNITVPFLHIADATAQKILNKGLKNIGLIGTKFTMNLPFYKTRLKEKFDINIITPNDTECDDIDRIIFDELCHGVLKPESKARFIEITKTLSGNGATGIILGCTEIRALLKQTDTSLQLFDTTHIHCDQAFKIATNAPQIKEYKS